jgi:hypothetical protein
MDRNLLIPIAGSTRATKAVAHAIAFAASIGVRAPAPADR